MQVILKPLPITTHSKPGKYCATLKPPPESCHGLVESEQLNSAASTEQIDLSFISHHEKSIFMWSLIIFPIMFTHMGIRGTQKRKKSDFFLQQGLFISDTCETKPPRLLSLFVAFLTHPWCLKKAKFAIFWQNTPYYNNRGYLIFHKYIKAWILNFKIICRWISIFDMFLK